ncbi:MAG TPA: ribonuclease Z, partial [Elusimicrobiales bacterium]|nr:ribonuclease Z [Elusimicrobiales bacterium]
HFHLDHVSGLHILLKFDLDKGLFICGGKGARGYIAALLRRPFSVPLDKLRYPAKVLELPARLKELPFKCSCLPLEHSDPVLGYRFEVDGRTVAFCTDTGYCANAVKLASGADLLISECTYLPGEETPGWPHMNPEKAAALAEAAGASRLALAHFEPNKYPTRRKRVWAAAQARRTFRNVFAASDGDRILL